LTQYIKHLQITEIILKLVFSELAKLVIVSR